MKVVLTTHRSDVSFKVAGALGEGTMSEAVYTPILDALADHKPKTLGQLEQALKDKGVAYAQIIQATLLLCGTGSLALLQDDADINKAKKHTDKLNAHLCNKARGSSDIGYLASPVTGGGFAVNRIQQLFLLCLAQGKRQPAEWVQFAWAILLAQGQKLVKDGNALESAEQNLAELTSQATTFAQKQLPILKALQIA